MHFSTTLAVLFTFFTATALSAPVPDLERRLSAAVFTTETYNQLSISAGVAGNAQAEALAKFSALNLANAKNVATADIEFLNSVNQIANQAEENAFNVAIDKASGAAKTALQNGKIKNKVLKLTASVLKLTVQAAQGQDTAASLATEQKKLTNNINLDKAAAGQASTALQFTATTSSK